MGENPIDVKKFFDYPKKKIGQCAFDHSVSFKSYDVEGGRASFVTTFIKRMQVSIIFWNGDSDFKLMRQIYAMLSLEFNEKIVTTK